MATRYPSSAPIQFALADWKHMLENLTTAALHLAIICGKLIESSSVKLMVV